MILGYLILAHLLADFIFQPSSLVRWKTKSKKGVFFHVLIHFLVTTIILLPFIINGYAWLIAIAFIISFIHFWIDQAKINYDLKHDHKILPFLIDQLLHLLTILSAYFFIQNISLNLPQTKIYSIYSNIWLIIFISFLILGSTVVEIYRFQKQREKNKNASFKINAQKMLTRIIVITLFYAFLMLLSFYARGNQVLYDWIR